MKVVISPAKSLEFEKPLPIAKYTSPLFLDQVITLNKKLERKSKKEIATLMRLSDALATLNYHRYKSFSTSFTQANSRAAVYAFNGDVYTGLDAYTITEDKMNQLQGSLRILSGMYGLLRPLDLIQPYRLEMGTHLKIGNKKNLYEFWDNTLTDALNAELESDELFVNLASNEYFKVLQPKKIKVPVISPVFKDFKNGKLKVISFFAKKARGSMVRYILDNDSKTLAQIKGFNYEGYLYSEEHTEHENEPVFIR